MQIGAMRAGLGYVSLGMNGQRSDGFINNARRNRMMLAQRCDKAVVEYGTNDLENGTTLENIKSYLSNIWEALHVRGVKQIYQTTIVPRTTSTDNWATTTNQTPTKAATSGGPDSTRTLLNEWIRSKPSPYLAGIIDIAPATEYGVNTGLWLPNKTPDGIHPNTQTHQAMADILADAVR
jgi:lysophospholipase L1-like esterase